MTHTRFAVAAHYRENAIVAVAREAARTGNLDRFYTTLYPLHLAPMAAAVPFEALRAPIEKQLRKRSFPGIPPHQVQSLVSLPELVRVGSNRTKSLQPFAERMKYKVKREFDRAVSKHISGSSSQVVITMAAAGEQTLRVVRRVGKVGVLHFVDSLPAFRNRSLRELAGLHAGHHEFVPKSVVARVERELELADVILVPSTFVARQLHQSGLPREKIVIEPYGVDLSLFVPPVKFEARARLKRKVRCLYVGSISHRKGIPFLIEAVRRLEHLMAEFILVGPSHSPEVLRDLPPNVTVHGLTGEAGVSTWMRKTDLFILPSLEDAYPLVTLEAMASGLPVILTDRCGTSELLDDGEQGFIVPAGDAKLLSVAIEMLVENDALRSAMGAAARSRVEGGHSWEEYGKRVIERLCGEVTPHFRAGV